MHLWWSFKQSSASVQPLNKPKIKIQSKCDPYPRVLKKSWGSQYGVSAVQLK